jgi:hypothetical protein
MTSDMPTLSKNTLMRAGQRGIRGGGDGGGDSGELGVAFGRATLTEGGGGAIESRAG